LSATTGDGENKSNRCSLGDRCKGVFVVDMRDLSVSFGDESDFESWVGSFRVLNFECISGSNDFVVVRAGDNSVCAMFIHRAKFHEDGFGPLGCIGRFLASWRV
jgi:hypothetical protein